MTLFWINDIRQSMVDMISSSLLLFCLLVHHESVMLEEYLKEVKPYGPAMCMTRCGRQGACLRPLFSVGHLTCLLSDNMDTVHEGYVFIPMEHVSRSLDKGMVGIYSRSGVYKMIPSTRREPKLYPTDGPPLNISSSVYISDPQCQVDTMAVSSMTPDLLYILVNCQMLKNCLRHLLLLHMRNMSFADNNTTLCEAREGRRQIFAGPCVKSPGSCLYSINTGLELYITTYTEVSVQNAHAKVDMKKFKYRFTGRAFQCSLHTDDHLLCIVDGHSLYTVQMNKRHLIKLTKIKMSFKHFDIQVYDFKLDSVGTMSSGILVENSTLHRVLVDMRNRTITRRMSVQFQANAVAIGDGVLFVYSNAHRGLLYACETRTLDKCLLRPY